MDTEFLKKKYVLGIAMRTSFQNDQYKKAIPAHWDRFFHEGISEKIPQKLSNEIYAIYTDYEGDYTKPYTYIIGHEVSNLDTFPEDMTPIIIPESKYAVFTAQGIHGIIETWHTIWDTPIERAYLVDFEIYPKNFAEQENPEIKLYLSINK